MGQHPARDAPQGGALRNARSEKPSATVWPPRRNGDPGRPKTTQQAAAGTKRAPTTSRRAGPRRVGWHHARTPHHERNRHAHYATCVDLTAGPRAATQGTGHPAFSVPPGSPTGIPTKTAAAVRRAWEVRIQQIHDLLINAVVGKDPPNDGIAEPGMVFTIRYDATGDTETFLLGVHGAEYADMAVYSIQSPLGAAIAGARPGERRTYHLPTGAALAVTLLKAVPYGIHTSGLN